MSSELDAMYAAAVAEVNTEIARALDAIWDRRDGLAVMSLFRDGKLAFVIDKGGIRFSEIEDAPPGQAGTVHHAHSRPSVHVPDLADHAAQMIGSILSRPAFAPDPV